MNLMRAARPPAVLGPVGTNISVHLSCGHAWAVPLFFMQDMHSQANAIDPQGYSGKQACKLYPRHHTPPPNSCFHESALKLKA